MTFIWSHYITSCDGQPFYYIRTSRRSGQLLPSLAPHFPHPPPPPQTSVRQVTRGQTGLGLTESDTGLSRLPPRSGRDTGGSY